MIEILTQYIDSIAKIIEFVGVMIMVLGLIYAFYKTISSLGHFTDETYVSIRQAVGKSILLGLEVLIAADIMATVVTEPTLKDVLVLGFIVLIRTFLSLSLQVELEGRFPWQSKKSASEKRLNTPQADKI
ncbi:DUF1622 domain-containing protein [Psychrobacter aquaticus]|uniref:DUF1622 domain-containing protein n=1 Tax=Psychrobacter aquaticus CMS 56 TaxID=1354303 RepID=U4T7T7_9GAMM|nr:DUF1622 domain-containing protein [Psychrobacter aquaticus]ERL54799.1 protein of unknown function DUF1622 [Psychrobacter aquaticus CMS 56]